MQTVSLRSVLRKPLDGPDACPLPIFQPLINTWFDLWDGSDDLPHFSAFDPTLLPGRLWKHLYLCKLEGTPRRFFYELSGAEVDRNNGFSGSKKFLFDMPLPSRHVVARELAIALRNRRPTFSKGPYLGRAEYVTGVDRVVTPYRLDGNEFAFLAGLQFLPDPPISEADRAAATIRGGDASG